MLSMLIKRDCFYYFYQKHSSSKIIIILIAGTTFNAIHVIYNSTLTTILQTGFSLVSSEDEETEG